MAVLHKIDRFLRQTQMSATRFGRIAVNDPRLVGDLRRGREPRPRTVAKIDACIAACLAGRSGQ